VKLVVIETHDEDDIDVTLMAVPDDYDELKALDEIGYSRYEASVTAEVAIDDKAGRPLYGLGYYRPFVG
jgi:hypothetical protein